MSEPARRLPQGGQEEALKHALLEDCEATFNIDIEACEAEALRTVGDLYSVIRWKCQSDSPRPPGAAIADSYRALRQHLRTRGVTRPIRPTSPLPAVLGADPRAEWAVLRRSFGKALPRLELTEGQHVVVSMVVALGLAGGVFGGLYVADTTSRLDLGILTALSALAATLFFVGAYSLFFARAIPIRLWTVGDLARAVAEQTCRTDRAGPMPAALWDALEDIVRRGTAHEGKVTADLAVQFGKKEARESHAR